MAPQFTPGSTGWSSFKSECAKQVGQEQYMSENKKGYQGDVSAKVNGSHGGPIGGQMVKRMIEQAEKQFGG